MSAGKLAVVGWNAALLHAKKAPLLLFMVLTAGLVAISIVTWRHYEIEAGWNGGSMKLAPARSSSAP